MVLDTHLWVWLVTGARPVPAEVLAALRDPKVVPAISAVSVWEAHLLMERGAIGAVATPEATVRTWLAAYPIEVVPIDLEVALLSRSLAFTHADPADRFIAATTFKLGRVLATLDENLRALPWLRCLPLE